MGWRVFKHVSCTRGLIFQASLKEAATTAVKAAQQVLKDIRAIFSEKSRLAKEAKDLAAAAKAKAVPKAKSDAKSCPNTRANGKQAGK